MKIIGVTGGVGAGKSQVLSYLKEQYEAHVIQADHVGHLVIEPGGACYEAVLGMFGTDVRMEDGGIDRGLVAQRMFGHEDLRQKMNHLIHPAVKKYILQEIRRGRAEQWKALVVEAALLLEDDYGAFCDELWYIYASEQTRARRLMESRGYSGEKIKNLFASQYTETQFREGCDFTLYNDEEFSETEKQIDKRMEQYEIM